MVTVTNECGWGHSTMRQVFLHDQSSMPANSGALLVDRHALQDSVRFKVGLGDAADWGPYNNPDKHRELWTFGDMPLSSMPASFCMARRRLCEVLPRIART
jgi:hypothetical protein